MYNLNNGIDESTTGGGIIRYHRADWIGDAAAAAAREGTT